MMDSFFVLVAHNLVFTLGFALCVYCLTRVWRNPPVAHALWLLVLLKLVAPPVTHVDLSALWLPASTNSPDQVVASVSPIDTQKAKDQLRFDDWPASQTSLPASATSANAYDYAASSALIWIRVRPLVLCFWLGGAALCALVATARIVRFERLLRDTLRAPERLQRIASEVAGKIGVRRIPDIRYVQSVEVPLLWCAGRRPTIVLPMRLVHQFDDQQIAMILAHELAHVRRRDHWVRAAELIVSTLYWWNPLVWLIRRQLHQAEDLSCDAWVRWSFPQCAKSYAEVVFKTAQSLSASQVGARLLPASPFLRSLSLKARIEMILESRFAPQVSRQSTLITTLFALLVLPTFVQTTTTALAEDEIPATPAPKLDTPTTSAFPYTVRFEQGATHFEDGDNITIVEIRGTSEKFIPGNIYWIKGTYRLASHDRAMLAAYITANNAADGTGRSFTVQRKEVDQGQGTFTLFLPMLIEGLPHVSFYGKGESFGGNYFGTGDSVLQKWWGSN